MSQSSRNHSIASLAADVYYNDDPVESSTESFYIVREDGRHAGRTPSMASINTTTSTIRDMFEEERRKHLKSLSQIPQRTSGPTAQTHEAPERFPTGSLVSYLQGASPFGNDGPQMDAPSPFGGGWNPGNAAGSWPQSSPTQSSPGRSKKRASSPFQATGSSGVGTPRSASAAVSLAGHHRSVQHEHTPSRGRPDGLWGDMVRTPRSGTPVSIRAGHVPPHPDKYKCHYTDVNRSVSNASSSRLVSELQDGGNAAVKSKLEVLRNQLNNISSQQEQQSQRAAFIQSERVDSLFDCCDQLSKMLLVESEHRAKTEHFLADKLDKLMNSALVSPTTKIVGGTTVSERLDTELDAVESSLELLITRADRIEWDLDNFRTLSLASEQQRELGKKAFMDGMATMFNDITAVTDKRIAYEVRFTSDIQSEIASLYERVDKEKLCRERVLERCAHIAGDIRRSTLVPGAERLSASIIADRLNGIPLENAAPLGENVTILDIKAVVQRLMELVQEDSHLRREGHGVIQSAALDAMRRLK